MRGVECLQECNESNVSSDFNELQGVAMGTGCAVGVEVGAAPVSGAVIVAVGDSTCLGESTGCSVAMRTTWPLRKSSLR